MEPEEINWTDWQRIFIGEAPPSFFLELIVRTIILFFLLIVSLRLMGKRMSAQLSRVEMTALFVLAGAIGVPLPSPDRGLLPAVAIALIVILVGRIIARWAFNNPRFERTAVDDYSTLVKDGVLQMKEMRETRISIERLHSYLRGKKVMHLGQIERVYFEANGSLSLVLAKNPKPGLSVLPAEDAEFRNEQQEAQGTVCNKCGSDQTKEDEGGERCANCGVQDQTQAVT